jgi:hypothetical protein
MPFTPMAACAERERSAAIAAPLCPLSVANVGGELRLIRLRWVNIDIRQPAFKGWKRNFATLPFRSPRSPPDAACLFTIALRCSGIWSGALDVATIDWK